MMIRSLMAATAAGHHGLDLSAPSSRSFVARRTMVFKPKVVNTNPRKKIIMEIIRLSSPSAVTATQFDPVLHQPAASLIKTPLSLSLLLLSFCRPANRSTNAPGRVVVSSTRPVLRLRPTSETHIWGEYKRKIGWNPMLKSTMLLHVVF